MSQEDVLEILGNRELTRKEIEELTMINQQSISRCLKQLIKYHEIIREYSDNLKKFVYKKKRGEGFCPLPKNKK
jgi:hypothetical protein